MKIGVRAHDYGAHSIREMAELLQREGYEAAQVALPKAFTELRGYEDITEVYLEEIREAFAEANIEIPVFGCYMDLGNPDPQVRDAAVCTLKKCLYYGKQLGAWCVGTETAYPHLTSEEKQIWRPYMMDSILRVMEEACRIDMRLAIEPVYWHPLADLSVTREVIDRVGDETHLRLIFDASNLLEYPETTNQDQYWEEWLSEIGAYVDVMHIKDFCLDPNRKYQPRPLGEGVLDYGVIRKWLHENKPDMYLLREEMDPRTAAADIAYLRSF